MPRLFYPPLVEPGVYVKPKGIQQNRAESSYALRPKCILRYAAIAAITQKTSRLATVRIEQTPEAIT